MHIVRLRPDEFADLRDLVRAAARGAQSCAEVERVHRLTNALERADDPSPVLDEYFPGDRSLPVSTTELF